MPATMTQNRVLTVRNTRLYIYIALIYFARCHIFKSTPETINSKNKYR